MSMAREETDWDFQVTAGTPAVILWCVTVGTAVLTERYLPLPQFPHPYNTEQITSEAPSSV